MKNGKNQSEIYSEKNVFGIKKSKVANRLKRALPKFRGDRSEVRGVTGRSKLQSEGPIEFLSKIHIP